MRPRWALTPRKDVRAHSWRAWWHSSGYLAMVWKPQYRAGLQHCSGQAQRSLKLWTDGAGQHERRSGIALGCRCWCLNQGHEQGDSNAVLRTVCLEPAVGTERELRRTCRWRKGAVRKCVFQASFCKTEPVLQVLARLGWWPLFFLLLNVDKCAGITGSSKRGLGFEAQQLGGTDLHCHDSFPKNTCVSPLTVQGAQGDQLDVDVCWGDVWN